jgi:N-acetylgalactosamine kinase
MESTDNIPCFNSLKDIYSDLSILKNKNLKLQNSIKKYKEVYGKEPEYFARAPGRVNIIGEHIDYNGYGVLPFALHMEIWFLFGKNDLNKIRMSNCNSSRFKSEEYSNIPDDWTSSPTGWTGYIIWGFRSILFLMEKHNLPCPKVNEKTSIGTGLDLLVYSDLPIACGVSSSSALSVGSCLVLAKMLNVEKNLDRTTLVSNIIEFERKNGLKSGGMDQTVSVFGQTDNCLAIDFKPKLDKRQVPMKGMGMILCNSLTESPKVETGFKRYNKRVFECTMGLKALLRKSLGKDAKVSEYPTLWDLQTKLSINLDEMNKLVEETLGSTKQKKWKLEELYAFLEIKDYKEIFGEDQIIELVTQKNDHFFLYERLKHVIEESIRVNQFISIVSKEDDPKRLQTLGTLMTNSQKSCADLYDCSSENLNFLTQKSLECGALGSRLTGAGWGGCFINLVPLDSVIDKIL